MRKESLYTKTYLHKTTNGLKPPAGTMLSHILKVTLLLHSELLQFCFRCLFCLSLITHTPSGNTLIKPTTEDQNSVFNACGKFHFQLLGWQAHNGVKTSAQGIFASVNLPQATAQDNSSRRKICILVKSFSLECTDKMEEAEFPVK